MQARSNLFSPYGGDTVQILKTKEYLEKLGLEVKISTRVNEDLSEYDIVHLFNLTRVQETYYQILNATKFNKPIVLSTIYWPTDELELNGQGFIRKNANKLLGVSNIEKLKNILKYCKGERSLLLRDLIKINYTEAIKEILRLTDWFLPNSSIEMKKISEKYEFETKNFTRVVNAIDVNLLNSTCENKYGEFKDSIICIGRVEPRKNQLQLVKALYDTDYKLVIIGKYAPNHKKYYDEVKRVSNNNTNFIDFISNEEIYQICKVAKVHVLPSWYDTPGLSSLEAASCGCNIVVSEEGTTKDYFGDKAFYCNHKDVDSILRAVESAYNAEKSDVLSKYVAKNYCWQKAAEQTFEGYLNAIKVKK